MPVSLARLMMSAQQWTAPDGGGIFQKAVSKVGLRSIALVRLPIPSHPGRLCCPRHTLVSHP
jgi:hypothetical protein